MQARMQQRASTAMATSRRSAVPTPVRCQAVSSPQGAVDPSQVAAAPKNQLEALRRVSTVVADTGDVALIKKYKPQDATTNPSLVLKAVQAKEYEYLLRDAVKGRKAGSNTSRPWAEVADELTVNLGLDILQIVPGRVSTEVDAHLSFNTQATYDKALRLMDLYVKKGVDPKRVYIKIASTWEGIEACRRLQRQGIDTNMTLLFSFAQAAACADAGAALISPFVGRIMDWYKAKEGRDFTPEEDPGVHSVKRIYSYYKTHGYDTIVMAASFRNVGEIRELAGCDNITISPQLLGELEASTAPLPRKLDPSVRDATTRLAINATTFSALHNADQMAVDKLAQGIEGFAVDQRKLEDLLAKAAAEL